MSSPTVQKVRRIVLTGSVAAITAAGAWYGAGLKTQQQFKQELQAVRAIEPDERIAQLESAKDALLRQRAELQEKIDDFTAKAARSKAKTAKTGPTASATGSSTT